MVDLQSAADIEREMERITGAMLLVRPEVPKGTLALKYTDPWAFRAVRVCDLAAMEDSIMGLHLFMVGLFDFLCEVSWPYLSMN